MAITNKGILAYEIHDTNVDKHIFLSFMQNKVLPYSNNKKIIMDNIRFHKTKLLLQTLKDNNTDPFFIPPYSPQFNSIEYVFNIMKTKYRHLNNGKNSKQLIIDIINSLKNTSFNNIFKHIRKI
jgi:transposase